MIIRVKNIALVVIATIISSITWAQNGADEFFSSSKPKLLVEVIIGGARYDQLYQIRNNFSENGFRKLILAGSVYTNALYSIMHTSPECGSAVIAMGSNPAANGMVGTSWVNLTTNEIVDAFHSDKYQGVGCNENEGQFSPQRLIATTLADQLKSSDSKSKVYSIALDHSEAIIHGGVNPDGCFWFDERYGGFVTSSYYQSTLDKWNVEFNDSKRKELYTSEMWSIDRPIDKYLYKNATTVVLDPNKKYSFDTIFRQKGREYKRLRETPMGNSYIKDFAIELLRQDSLGKDDSTDLLVINLGAHRNIAQKYGAESTETEDSFYRLDKDIADLIETLESSVGKENFLVVLTSSHGISSNVSQDQSDGGGKFNAMQFKALISGYLNVNYGSNHWVTEYNNRQIYLNRPLIYEKKIDLEEIQTKIATIALQFDGVANAITTSTLQSNYANSGTFSKMQNSFFPRHGGDVVINLLPGWVEVKSDDDKDVISSWGSPYRYDIHVPLVFYGKGISSQIITKNIDIKDVAPTLSQILGIAIPNASEGKVLDYSK